MAVVNELLRSEKNGTISFGNHKLAEKAKLDDEINNLVQYIYDTH